MVSIPRQLRLQVRLIQEDWHTYAKCEKRDRPLPVYVNNQLQFSGMQHQTAAVGSLSIELALRRIRE